MRHDLYYTINHWAPNETGPNDETTKVSTEINRFFYYLPKNNFDLVYIHVDLSKCEKYPEDKPYFGGWELGRIISWYGYKESRNDPLYIEWDIILPESWTLLTGFNTNSYGGLYLYTTQAIRLTSRTLTKIDKLFSGTSSTTIDTVFDTLDLRKCTALKEVHRLYDEIQMGDGSSPKRCIYVYDVLFPTESIEDLSAFLSFNPSKVREYFSVSAQLITSLFSYKWPKLKNLSNALTEMEVRWENIRTPRYMEDYPIRLLDVSGKMVFDFSVFPALENVTSFCRNGKFSEKFWKVSIVGLGNDHTTLDLTNLFYTPSTPSYFQVEMFSYKNCTGDGGDWTRWYENIKSFTHNGGSGLPILPDGIPGIVTADITSYTWNYNRPSVYINTGDPALDNQIHQKIPNATVGIPAGWTHLFSRN